MRRWLICSSRRRGSRNRSCPQPGGRERRRHVHQRRRPSPGRSFGPLRSLLLPGRARGLTPRRPTPPTGGPRRRKARGSPKPRRESSTVAHAAIGRLAGQRCAAASRQVPRFLQGGIDQRQWRGRFPTGPAHGNPLQASPAGQDGLVPIAHLLVSDRPEHQGSRHNGPSIARASGSPWTRAWRDRMTYPLDGQ
jgi:hypothetical protein